MSSKNKNKNKAAAQAPAQKAQVEKPADATTGKEAQATTQEKKETPKGEVTNDNKGKKGAQPQPPKGSTQKPKKEEHVPTLIPEEVADNKLPSKTNKAAAGIPAGIPGAGSAGSAGPSADAYAMLAYVGYHRYAKNEEFKKQYPEAYEQATRSVDAVWLLGMVAVQKDMIARAESGELKLTVDAEMIMPLNETAKLLGIELAPVKMLDDGKQGTLNFTESKFPEQLEKYERPAIKEYNLDTTKAKSDEELKEVLNYLLNSTENVAKNVVAAVEFFRTYTINQESDGKKKLAYDDFDTTEWMDRLFALVKPGVLLSGLGRTVYLRTKASKSPLHSHALLHHHMGQCGWNELQIASVVKMLVKENFRYNLKNDPELEPGQDKALVAISGELGNTYIDELLALSNKKVDKDDPESENVKMAKGIIGILRTNYFPNTHTPTPEEMRNLIGSVLNLYRSPQSRMIEYTNVYNYPVQTAAEKPAEVPAEKSETEAGEKKN